MGAPTPHQTRLFKKVRKFALLNAPAQTRPISEGKPANIDKRKSTQKSQATVRVGQDGRDTYELASNSRRSFSSCSLVKAVRGRFSSALSLLSFGFLSLDLARLVLGPVGAIGGGPEMSKGTHAGQMLRAMMDLDGLD